MTAKGISIRNGDVNGALEALDCLAESCERSAARMDEVSKKIRGHAYDGPLHYYNHFSQLVVGCGTPGCEECRKGGVSS